MGLCTELQYLPPMFTGKALYINREIQNKALAILKPLNFLPD